MNHHLENWGKIFFKKSYVCRHERWDKNLSWAKKRELFIPNWETMLGRVNEQETLGTIEKYLSKKEKTFCASAVVNEKICKARFRKSCVIFKRRSGVLSAGRHCRQQTWGSQNRIISVRGSGFISPGNGYCVNQDCTQIHLITQVRSGLWNYEWERMTLNFKDSY